MALVDSRIDHRYISLIKNISDTATACVRLHKGTNTFRIERGVRQGDTISPKLFTTVLEYMYKRISFEGNMGVNINGEDLNHLRFANDIFFISDSTDKATRMLEKLYRLSSDIGLKINCVKTKFMNNLVLNDNISVGDHKIEQVTTYKYLGYEIRLGEILRRIGLT